MLNDSMSQKENGGVQVGFILPLKSGGEAFVADVLIAPSHCASFSRSTKDRQWLVFALLPFLFLNSVSPSFQLA